MDLLRGVHPTDRLAHGRFGLDEHQRDAVDQQHQVGATLRRAGAEGVLGSDDVLVAVEIGEVNQVDGDVLVALAEGHGAVPAQPGGELLVGLDQAVAAHAEDECAQLVQQLVGAVGLGGDGGVEADERGAHLLFDQHVVGTAVEVGGWDKVPACPA